MKIAYLLGSLNRGGLETLVLDVLNNHSKADFEMICVHRKPGSYYDEFHSSGVPCYQITLNKLFGIKFILKLRHLLLSQRVDIIHAQTSLDGTLAYLATLGTNIKVITSYHGFNFSRNRLSSIALKYSNRNIFVSNYQKQVYEEVYNLSNLHKNAVVYNGINFDKISSANYPSIEFISEGRAENRVQICMVGNFVCVRDQNTICRFSSLLKESGIAFDLYFVGKRCDNESWRYDDCVAYCKENNLTDCVHFLGGRGDVPAILQQMDVFVYSTDHDTFGIAVIEAIAANLPTFVNDWPVMTEVTANGEYATIYKTKDEGDLFVKFMEFVNNKDKYIKEANRYSKEIMSLYDISAHISSLSKLYKRVL